MLTTTEAAALLSERGYTGNRKRDGTNVLTADAVKRMCYRGAFPNAKHYAGSGRGVWLIPVEDVEAYAVKQAHTPA